MGCGGGRGSKAGSTAAPTVAAALVDATGCEPVDGVSASLPPLDDLVTAFGRAADGRRAEAAFAILRASGTRLFPPSAKTHVRALVVHRVHGFSPEQRTFLLKQATHAARTRATFAPAASAESSGEGSASGGEGSLPELIAALRGWCVKLILVAPLRTWTETSQVPQLLFPWALRA